MAEGKNKIARSLLDLQPTAILDFYQIYPDIVNQPTLSINMHGGSVFGGSLVWQGVEYDPVAIECEGFEIIANGRLPRPKIRIANKDFLVTKLLQNYNDLKNGQIIRKRTFLKYLDDTNFDGGNPFGDADSTAEISQEKFVIGQKTQENKILVELELTSPLDLENFELNHRRILGKYCYWQYRGHGCRYNGEPIEKENGDPFEDPTGGYVVPDLTNFNSSDPTLEWSDVKSYNASDIVYRKNPNIRIQSLNRDQSSDGELVPELEPMKIWYVCVSGNSGEKPEENPTYWQKDGCSKKLSACKRRFLEGSHEGYVSADLDKEKDYIQFSGLGTDSDTASGYFASTDSNLTGIFTGDFTIAMYLEPEGGDGTGARYLDLFSGNNGYGFGSTGENFGISYEYDTNSTRNEEIGLSQNSLGRVAIFLQHDQSEKTLYVKSAIDKGSVVTNYEENIESAGGTNFVWDTNVFAIGANVNANNPTVRAKYYNVAVWSGFLSDNKLGQLLTFEKDSSASRFIEYDDLSTQYADLNLDTDLIAWYQNTGSNGGYDRFEDSHSIGGYYHLTGFGNYKLDTEDYKIKYIPSSSQGLPKDSNYLPFGGFPGTDGFSYQQQ